MSGGRSMLIKVNVVPDSRDDIVEQTGPDTYTVCVRAKPQHGHANKLATHLLATYFKTQVRMVSGGTRTSKVFRVG